MSDHEHGGEGSSARPSSDQSSRHIPEALSVPVELRTRDQWVCWRYEDRGGKPTKVPISAKTKRLASVRDAGAWTGFDDALAVAKKDPTLAGVGFVFTPDDPFCGIDLDGCVDDNGNIVREARKIIDSLNSYTEVSPSGRGVKVFITGRKPEGVGCKSKAIAGFKETEIYDRERFFTVTGQRVMGVSECVEVRQDALDALCARLWPESKSLQLSTPNADIDFTSNDELLIERAAAARNGDRFARLWNGDTSLHCGDDSAADLALCSMLAFWTGKDAERMDRLFRRSGLYREKWDEKRGARTYGQMTVEAAIGGCAQSYSVYQPRRRQALAGTSPLDEETNGNRPVIVVTTDESRVVVESINALAKDESIYQRGGMLVQIMQPDTPLQMSNRNAQRDPVGGSPQQDGASPALSMASLAGATVRLLPAPTLRERLTQHAILVQHRMLRGVCIATPKHPSSWLINAIISRGQWEGVRELRGVSEVPVLRRDGSVCQHPGYDPATCLYYAPQIPLEPIDENVVLDDADESCSALLDVIADFSFESNTHRSAWLAALLTPIARSAFDGPAPLFLFDANVRGAGKSLLVQIIARVVLGRSLPVNNYASDTEEMRKKITALAISGERLVVLDNIAGAFGNDAIDRMLTSTYWQDRLLGGNQNVNLPLETTWYATGNNVMIAADTARRVLHARLDVIDERPEERKGFQHPDILGWVVHERSKLLRHALTILRAYILCGKPEQNLVPFGSYEGWSRLIRGALVWAGQPDPCLARDGLIEMSDTTVDTLSQLFDAWTEYLRVNPELGGRIIVSHLLARLYDRDNAPGDRASVSMRAALENLVGVSTGKPPGARQVGAKLKQFRQRIVNGRRLELNPARNRAGSTWELCATHQVGDSKQL